MRFALVCIFLAALLLFLLALIPDQSSGGTVAKRQHASPARGADPLAAMLLQEFQYQPPSLPWLKAVADFYSGNNPRITIGVDPRAPGYMGATAGVEGSGDVLLGEGIWEGLRNFDQSIAAAKRGNKDAMNKAVVLGVNSLAVLLHELTHSRPTGSERTGGFRGWGDERQAAALGAELVPDLLQRFFGIKIGSPLSRQFERAAKGRAEYEAAYHERS